MNVWYDIFVKALHEKYPQKSELTEALMDLLSIEREAAYRRLRKDVMFAAEEVFKIASAWNISLDEIVGGNSKQVFFRAQLLNYVNSSKEEIESMERIIKWCKSLENVPDLEYLEACNKIPRSLTAGFPCLRKLQLLRWMYRSTPEEVVSFSQINFQPAVAKLSSDYYRSIKNLAQTVYIWDYMLFNNVISDIRYFHSIYLITDEEKELLKHELHTFLDYMSKVADRGCWPETEKQVQLYISHINIDTNYSYFYSKDVKLCIVHAFVKNEIYTGNSIMVEDFKKWMQSKKRSSILISEADDKSRIDYFKKQHQLVDEL